MYKIPWQQKEKEPPSVMVSKLSLIGEIFKEVTNRIEILALIVVVQWGEQKMAISCVI